MKKQVHSDIKLFIFEIGSNCAYPYSYDVENISMNLIVEAFRLQKVEIIKKDVSELMVQDIKFSW